MGIIVSNPLNKNLSVIIFLLVLLSVLSAFDQIRALYL